MLKHIKPRIRLGKKKLLTGELRKSEFSSEAFSRFAKRGEAYPNLCPKSSPLYDYNCIPFNIWEKGTFLFPILSKRNSLDAGTISLNTTECFL